MAESAPFEWDDVRVFLAVLRAASARRAAADLGVSRPTVARRLAALEARVGLRLFERARDGLHATAAAKALLPAAEEAERAMLAVARAADAADEQMRGPIRATMPAVVAADLLMDDIVAFCRRWPRIDLHLGGGYELSSLAQRQADVAVRFMPLGQTPGGDLVGRKVATAYVAIYGEGDSWIGQRGGEADQAWIQASPFPDLPVRGRMIDGEIIRSACERGWASLGCRASSRSPAWSAARTLNRGSMCGCWCTPT